VNWKPWPVSLSRQAQKDLEALPKDEALRIVSALRTYAETGAGHVLALQGRSGFRLRMGDYRALFERIEEPRQLLVLRIAHRRQAYR
jgi:mRNA interferase RelE/StbE